MRSCTVVQCRTLVLVCILAWDDFFVTLNKSQKQVELKRENEYIPIFKYILSFKDSSSY